MVARGDLRTVVPTNSVELDLCQEREGFGAFADELASKVSEFCRVLVNEYEESLSENHITECNRIRNESREQELQLRADVSVLKEWNQNLLSKVAKLQAEVQQLAGDANPSLRMSGGGQGASASGDAGATQALARPDGPLRHHVVAPQGDAMTLPGAVEPSPPAALASASPQALDGARSKMAWSDPHALDVSSPKQGRTQSAGAQERKSSDRELFAQEVDEFSTGVGDVVHVVRARRGSMFGVHSSFEFRPVSFVHSTFSGLRGFSNALTSRMSRYLQPSRLLSMTMSDMFTSVADGEAMEDVQRSKYMLHPNSRISMTKDIISVFCLAWDGVTLPYILAWNPPNSPGMMIVSTFVTVFWTIEMFMTMNTGFYRSGMLEMNRSKALFYYVKRWFIVDACTVGSDWVGFTLDRLVNQAGGSTTGLVLIRLVKLNRLLRLARAFRVMKVYEHLQNIGVSLSGIYLTGSWPVFFKVVQYALAIFWLNHLVACMWFSIGKYVASDTGLTWLEFHTLGTAPEDLIPLMDVSPLYQYMSSLHYVVTQTVLGSMSINPTNSLERLFTVICLVMGFLCSSMLVSTLSSWLVQMQIAKHEKVATMAALRRFLRENTVTASLANRIDFHILMRINESPPLREEQVNALEMLTPALRSELRKDMWSKFLLSNPVFRAWDFLDHKITESLCSWALEPMYLSHGEELFNPNTKATRAFIVAKGGLVYAKVSSNRYAGKCNPLLSAREMESDSRAAKIGTWLAQAAMWIPWTYLGNATAHVDSELLALSGDVLRKVVGKHPHIQTIMRHYVEAYEHKFSVLDNDQLNDIDPCVEHAVLIYDMDHKSRMYMCFAALRALKQRYAFRAFVGETFERLEHEISSGARALAFDTNGSVERIKRLVSLRLRRPDGRLLMQICRQSNGVIDKDPKLLSHVLANEEPEEGLARLLSGDFTLLGSSVTFGQVSSYTHMKSSKTYAAFSLNNVCIDHIYSASLPGDIVLPGKQGAIEAAEILKHTEVNAMDVQLLDEVHKLQNGMGEEIICVWMAPNSEEDFLQKRQNNHRRSNDGRRISGTRRPSVKEGAGAAHEPDARVTSLASFSVAPRRVPCPQFLHDKPVTPHDGETGVPLLRSLLKDAKTDWHCARRMATRICDPEYTCEDYFRDCITAFPELGLYMIASSPHLDQPGHNSHMTSGRTTDDEYQRTIGAFFSFFWLMRLDLEGADSFSFGLDEHWNPRVPPAETEKHTDETKRRIAFRQNADWVAMQQLLEDAGVLKRDAAVSESQHDPERTLAMLSLTAYHDIMKVQALLPTVAEEHGSWCGFKAGDVIDDHDAALGYILEHYPDLLPSFVGLPVAAQRSVRFTQCKMEYNMGWLVQAEAPPGALLSTLRRTVLSGNASGRDIAFYFVHWFTDLAGAVPTPLSGSEKFVLGFPLKVLSSFVHSFAIVGDLGNAQSETQVYENYLRWRWDTHKPPLGPAPEGFGAIAKMRLVTMAQGNSKLLLAGWRDLPEDDRRVLSEELARTGCEGQRFRSDTLKDLRGPAFLVYYGPALLQKAGLLDAHGALRILAELYRQARAMWPLKSNFGGVTVTIRIDALKAETVQTCKSPPLGETWCLEKVSERSALVLLMKLRGATIDWTTHCILNFSDKTAEATEPKSPDALGVIGDSDHALVE